MTTSQWISPNNPNPAYWPRETQSHQVLYKRKPVQYEEMSKDPEDFIDDFDDVWVIDETGEMYGDYAKFLKRMYFYSQHKFTCAITGQSGLDFFAAYRSAQDASDDVEDAFPEPLRGPILRKVQHSTISRIDNLGTFALSF